MASHVNVYMWHHNWQQARDHTAKQATPLRPRHATQQNATTGNATQHKKTHETDPPFDVVNGVDKPRVHLDLPPAEDSNRAGLADTALVVPAEKKKKRRKAVASSVAARGRRGAEGGGGGGG